MLGLVTLDTLELPHPWPTSDTTAHRIVAAIGLRGTMCRTIAQPSPMFRVVATTAIHACQRQRVRPPSQAYDFHADQMPPHSLPLFGQQLLDESDDSPSNRFVRTLEIFAGPWDLIPFLKRPRRDRQMGEIASY